MSLRKFIRALRDLRASLEPNFSPETAFSGSGESSARGAGHCAVVAVIAYGLLGGQLVSARVHEQSHWFNRFSLNGREFDVDLTGDQFGFAPVRIERAGRLYSGSSLRSFEQLTPETLERAARLAERSSFLDLAQDLREVEQQFFCAATRRATTEMLIKTVPGSNQLAIR